MTSPAEAMESSAWERRRAGASVDGALPVYIHGHLPSALLASWEPHGTAGSAPRPHAWPDGIGFKTCGV